MGVIVCYIAQTTGVSGRCPKIRAGTFNAMKLIVNDFHDGMYRAGILFTYACRLLHPFFKLLSHPLGKFVKRP